jgi:phosphatidate phosphatase APP1
MIAFFPTYARRIDGGWRATVAGMVTRPLPEKSRRRSLAVAVLKRLLELDDADLATDVFRRRAESFLFQRVVGRRVIVELGGRRLDAGASDRTGHFTATFDLADEFVTGLGCGPEHASRWLSYAAVPDEEDGEILAATGLIQLVDASGVSVISDIDDTVKISQVSDRRELLKNTLLREFVAVPGMPEAYRRWEDEGATFHYVSSSPWQLSNCLCSFLGAAGLPAGSMHLKLFRLKDTTPLGRLTARKRSKRKAIEDIMADFPGRRFVLVGDSGERDPEVYAEVTRRRPNQVAGVLIRRVPDSMAPHKASLRFDRLARRMPAGSLVTFTAADELSALP